MTWLHKFFGLFFIPANGWADFEGAAILPPRFTEDLFDRVVLALTLDSDLQGSICTNHVTYTNFYNWKLNKSTKWQLFSPFFSNLTIMIEKS